MNKDLTLEEKYEWVNKVALKSINSLKQTTFAVYRRSLALGLKNEMSLFDEINEPKPGDLVLEISSYAVNPNTFQNIGTLKEVLPNGEYIIELLDGDEFKWTNAKMIKILT